MIDNYDSFTFNLVHYFRSLGQEVLVCRNDEITLTEISQLAPDYIVISPGPSDPEHAGLSLSIIKHFAGEIPLLGVCLGLQCIAQVFGATIEKAVKVMHGKTSSIDHNGSGLFSDLNNPLTVARYHSLIVNEATLSGDFEITAWSYQQPLDNNKCIDSNDGAEVQKTIEIMAIQHKWLNICGVQFHPEAILTEQGHKLLDNFLQQK